ncbi:hypothetical protein IMSHALPRED_006155 [Imshaugia aleurites]|uniref:Secreted protein n=1 Tax=Imshaugia aleurites TaxID=172621 RepID=A0A8H3IDS7_9LECA|nr:hypothetical protein IMSHALPRED_006155 [Imshaugia aleurites]
MSSSASGHMYLLFFALVGQKSSGWTVIVDVGQVGTRDAVAVTFKYDVVANVELERLDLWCLVCERGRALGEDVSLCGLKNRKKKEGKEKKKKLEPTSEPATRSPGPTLLQTDRRIRKSSQNPA